MFGAPHTSTRAGDDDYFEYAVRLEVLSKRIAEKDDRIDELETEVDRLRSERAAVD